MPLTTYAELQAEIANHLDRSDLTNEIQTFITLVEEDLTNKLRVREMIKRSTTTTGSSRYLALPSNYKLMRIVRLIGNPVRRLQFINEEEFTRVMQTHSGLPYYYTIHEEIAFDVVPSSSQTVELIYYAKIPALSDQNTSNAILESYPSLYLYGALSLAEPFLDNDERIEMWGGLYMRGLEGANLADRKSRYPTSGLVSRAIGNRP